MSAPQWHTSEDGSFVVRILSGWEAQRDAEEGGTGIRREDGAGELHLLSFPVPAGEPPDPAEELFAFLDDSEIELAEDEVEDVALADGAELALCEYISEEEGTGEATYWLVGVASLPGALVFAHYSCAAGEEAAEREAVHRMLATLRAPPTEGRPRAEETSANGLDPGPDPGRT